MRRLRREAVDLVEVLLQERFPCGSGLGAICCRLDCRGVLTPKL